MNSAQPIQINSPITGFSLTKKEAPVTAAPAAPVEQPVQKKPTMNEHVSRPEVLTGATYKLKTPLSEHAIYVTINHIEIGDRLYPFEIFLNSKDTSRFQWIVALTRIMSAVFRKGGDVTFMIEELKSVFDPNGGYFSPTYQRYIPSLVAEIGLILESHFQRIGVMEGGPTMDQNVAAFVKEKRKAFKEQGGDMSNASICAKCSSKSVVLADGCPVCLSCGDTKCS